MADDTGLVVTFRGDSGPMTKSLSDLQGQLKRFKDALQDATDPKRIALLNRAIEATGERLKALQHFTGKPFDNVIKKSNQAGQAILNTGRVIQDLPFAFNNFGSIANNLDPLFESFTQLRESAKTTGTSVGKSLLESLKGAGGIGLAISAVTAGITIWQMYGDSIKKALGFTKGVGEETEKAKEKIKSFAELQKESNREVARELSEVQKLKIVLESEITTRKEKEAAIKRLKDINPDYFKDLKIEDGLVKNLSGAYAEYVKSINARSEVKVLEAQLDQVNETITNLQSNLKGNKTLGDRLVKGVMDLSRQQGNVAAIGRQELKTRQQETAEAIKLNATMNDREAILKRLEELVQHIKVPGMDLKDAKVKTPKENFEFFNKFFGFNPDGTLSGKQESALMDAANDFSNKFNTIFEGLNFYPPGAQKKPLELAKAFWADFSKGMVTFKKDAFENIDFSKDVPEVKPPRTDWITDYLNSVKQELSDKDTFKDPLAIQRETILNQYRDTFKSVGQALPGMVKLGRFEVPIDLAFLLNPDAVKQQLDAAKVRIESLIKGLNDQVSATLRNMQTEAIASVGEALAAGITGNNIQNVFSGLFSALGIAMQDLGKALIATAVGLKAIREAFKTLNPVVAAAAGVGLIALGGIIKSQVSKAAPFAEGGLVFGPVTGIVGEGTGTSRSNPEIIAPLDKLKNYMGGGSGPITVIGRIKGNDIQLSNARTNKKNRRIR